MKHSRWLVAAIVILCVAGTAGAGQTKTKPKKTESSDSSAAALPMSTPEEIDRDIGEMLGAWQVGDVEAMHKYYDDSATFVSGNYEPPIVGWANYVVAYQKQRARIQAMQLIRRNTSVFTRGDMAWASYQWQFDAIVDNRQVSARGQTTLVFSRASDRWVIVHNHTSQICEAPPPSPNPPTQGAPAQTPPEPAKPQS